MTQSAVSYDATTNKARVRVTVTASGAAAPWQYTVAVRGTTVSSGTSSAGSVSVTVTNDCSITTQSVTAQVTDDLGRTVGTAATLNRALCPPPPDYPHARDRILAGPTLTEASFVDRLRAVGSPALAEGRSIYRTLVSGGVNPAFALGTFHAESHSGTRGYATVTKNWGNILYYDWTAAFGAVRYAPGNGYTYAKFPTWLHSIRALCGPAATVRPQRLHDGELGLGALARHDRGQRPPPPLPHQHHRGDAHPARRRGAVHDRADRAGEEQGCGPP